MQLLRSLPPERLTPSRLWAMLDVDTRRSAARALYDVDWDDEAGRLEADQAIASAMRFRPVAVRRLPVEKRVDYLLKAVHPDDSLGSSLLRALHLLRRRELLCAFLDELGIPQEDGVIAADHQVETPDPTQLTPAVKRLFERFPEAEIEVYLASLMAMDPDTWGGLAEVARESPAD